MLTHLLFYLDKDPYIFTLRLIGIVCAYMHCSALVCVVLALLLNCPNMDLLKELMLMGEALGYEGDTLRAFVRDQQA